MVAILNIIWPPLAQKQKRVTYTFRFFCILQIQKCTSLRKENETTIVYTMNLTIISYNILLFILSNAWLPISIINKQVITTTRITAIVKVFSTRWRSWKPSITFREYSVYWCTFDVIILRYCKIKLSKNNDHYDTQKPTFCTVSCAL